MQPDHPSMSTNEPSAPNPLELELALKKSLEALAVLTPERNREEWAYVQYNLAMVYVNRRYGDALENKECAIRCLRDAASVYNSKDHPKEWANIMFELASLYGRRKKGVQRENKEHAIQYFEKALRVYEPEGHPFEWAKCHRGIGRVFLELSQEFGLGYWEHALSHYMKALENLRREDFPEFWHSIHLEIAILYRERADFSEQDGLKAEEHYRKAFGFEEEKYPELHSTMRRLDELHTRFAEVRRQIAEAKQIKGSSADNAESQG
jgi:tetratricopeptide (TPR) repeat protein